MKRFKVLSLIPARSGSRSIPDKNIRLIAGKPLLSFSINHALSSKLINRTIVSTDSPIYADFARTYGAEAPFLRPSEMSRDSSTDLEAFEHALQWLEKNEGYVPDICVHLRPTYPIRKIEDIDNVIRILLDNPDIDSVRTIAPSKDTPMKMWFKRDDGLLSPVVKTELKEPYNMPRQLLPQVYLQNACIDAVRTRVITEMKSMTGTNIFGYVMDNNFDIDTEDQFQEVEQYVTKDIANNETGQNMSRSLEEEKTFCFDIDGVIATIVSGNKYDLAEAQHDNIQKINCLYENGHHIILFTARGSATGIDWTDVTKKQMRDWGVKHHKLLFGKPAADYYIDDKMLSLEKVTQLKKNY